MTVTIASTTDTERDVTALNTAANTDPKPQVVTEESSPAEIPVEAQAEEASELTDDVSVEADSVEEIPPEEAVAPPEEAPVKEASEETPPEEEAVPEEAPRKRRRRGRSYKDRASQLAREKAAESARADSLAREINALRQAAPASPTVAPPEVVEEPSVEAKEEGDKKPLQEDFETYEEFQENLVDWKVSRRLETHQQDERERISREQAQRAQEDLVAAHHARIDSFRSEHGDFDATLERGRHLPMTMPMQDTVLSSESGPALMYHLCKNPETCDRIASLPPLAAIKELGKLEAQLEVASSGPTQAARTVTKAPKPIKPVGGSATATSTVPMDQMSYQDYRRVRNKQEEEARANGRW